MGLYLLVKSGKQAGVYFEVKSNLKFGRKNADFILDDKSASSQHAQIKQISKDQYVLKDLGSKNGIKINGIREDEVLLAPGLTFELGNTVFSVIENPPDLVEGIPAKTKPKAPPPPPPASPNEGVSSKDKKPERKPIEPKTHRAPPVEKVEKDPHSFEHTQPSRLIEVKVKEEWHDILEQFSQDVLSEVKNQPQPISPFNPAVKLCFTRGIQVDTEWILGYGPRKIGSDEYDLTVFEPNAPETCFILFPTATGIKFQTQHSDIVFYNGSAVKECLVKAGDEVSIGDSLIRIEFIK
jgi:pSer/pThr/pTyr-binding forkhead associated (FHA) protein